MLSLRLLFRYSNHAITASTIMRGTPTPTPTPRPILAPSLMPLAAAVGEDDDPAEVADILPVVVAVELPPVDPEDVADREVGELPEDGEVVVPEFDVAVMLVLEVEVDEDVDVEVDDVVELCDSVSVADAGIRLEGRTLK